MQTHTTPDVLSFFGKAILPEAAGKGPAAGVCCSGPLDCRLLCKTAEKPEKRGKILTKRCGTVITVHKGGNMWTRLHAPLNKNKIVCGYNKEEELTHEQNRISSSSS